MEIHPVSELKTAHGKRQADHLADLDVSDRSMAFYVDSDGVEVVTVNAWIYKRLTSKAGIKGVFLAGE